MASSSAAAAGPPHVVTVKRELLAECLTCPLCHKLLRDATTISECLHTFCRKCICEKLTDEEVDCCPICNIDLGVVPIEKLRPDHNLQDVRSKIFPFKRKSEGSEAVTPITLPVRRKERSLSSLVVNTPRMSTQTGLTGRRTKPGARRAPALRGLAAAINESTKMEDENVDKLAETPSSAENSSRLAPNRRQSSSNAEPSSSTSNKDTDDHGNTYPDKAELWKPLNTLVEAANRTKSLRSSSQSPVIKAEQTNGPDNEGNVNKTRAKEHPHKSKVQDEKNNSVQSPLVTAKARRAQGASRKRRGLTTSAQELLGAANAQCDRRINPIWFSLVASFEQAGDPPLSQIQTSYLRIKDGNVTASFIQKYLAMKLALGNEAEVEITCRGQPVNPATTLHNIVEQWAKGGSSQKLQAAIGTSAKEFVTVLTYGRSKDSAQ